MAPLLRQPKRFAREKYDLIIIGGGVQGVMLTLEASCRGLKPLLLEAEDFGGATSFNSLRIIHGGFRYLQTLDMQRLMQSARERRWFLKTFPHLTRPLPCMVPLYGDGLRRPLPMRVALSLYNGVTGKRNQGMPVETQIPSGGLLSSEKVKERFPLVPTDGLRGGAIWYDAFVEDSQRLIIDALHLACHNGAAVLNYCPAKELMQESGRVAGVAATDSETGERYEFSAGVVVNNTGPWCRDFSARYDCDRPELFRSMIAWNILFDREQLSDCGIAVKSDLTSHTYFIVPWKGKLLAGTGHAPWPSESRKPLPTEAQINEFIEDLNHAIPGLELNAEEIDYVLPGLQSATYEGGSDLATREVLVDHGTQGGPRGLFSVSGVKFTTARQVAEKTLMMIFPKVPAADPISSHTAQSPGENSHKLDGSIDKETGEMLFKIADDESVVHLDDLFFRRTTLWEKPKQIRKLAPEVCHLLGWQKDRAEHEIERLLNLVDRKITIHQV